MKKLFTLFLLMACAAFAASTTPVGNLVVSGTIRVVPETITVSANAGPINVAYTNHKATASADTTLTMSADSSSADTKHTLELTNSDGTNYKTFTLKNAAATTIGTVIVPASTTKTVTLKCTGSAALLLFPDPTAGTVASTSILYGRNATTGSDETYTRASIAALTETLTNKRVRPRSDTTASSATPTINTDNVDVYYISALATAITSMTTNLSGTPNAWDQLEIVIVDNGTARAITWGASFTDGPVALPTTTVLGKTLRVYLERNVGNTAWACVATSSNL